MALFTVRPNRGTVLFFGLLAGGLFARSRWQKHEAEVFRRDAPQVHSSRSVLRCLLGNQVERTLWPRPAAGDAAPWASKLSLQLRRMVTEYEPGAWLGRCAPVARGLSASLEPVRGAARAASLARAVAVTLDDAARGRLRAIEVVESGVLGTQLAQLALEATALSTGAEAAWSTPLAPSATDLPALHQSFGLAGVALPANAEHAVLSRPELLLYQSTGARRLHRVTLEPGASAPARDDDVGRGVPVAVFAREGQRRVASDEGEALFLPSGAPGPVVPLPTELSEGAAPLGAWDAVAYEGRLWLAVTSAGRLRVWSTPSEGAVRWSEASVPAWWSEALVYGAVFLPGASAPHGRRDGLVARAAPSAEPSAAGGTGVERGGERRARAREALRGAAAAPTAASANPAGAAAHEPRVPALFVARAGGSALRLERWEAGAEGPSALLSPVAPAFDPSVRLCVAGDVTYVILRTADQLRVYAPAPSGETATMSAVLSFNEWQPGATPLELSCSPRGVLVRGEFTGQSAAQLLWLAREGGGARVVYWPRYGEGATLAGAVATAQGLVVAVQANHSLRAYHRAIEDPSWQGGALLSLLPSPAFVERQLRLERERAANAPGEADPVASASAVGSAALAGSAAPSASANANANANANASAAQPSALPLEPPTSVRLGALVSEGDAVGALLELRTGAQRAVVWVGSRDGGARWHGGG